MLELKINPLSLNQHESKILTYLFSAHLASKNYFLSSDTIYSLNLSDQAHCLTTYQITLTHDIFFWERVNPATKKIEPRFTIIKNDRFYGRGAYAEVFDTEGTLSIESNGLLKLKKKQPRLAKKLYVSYKISKERMSKEAALCLRATHLHAKPITFIANSGMQFCFLMMRKFPGKELAKILKENNAQLTIEQRYQISINLILALKEQVHDRGIVHRDIKPENIIVDLASNEVNIIDFGLSRYRDEEDFVSCGTPIYLAPECVNGGSSDEFADICSLGLTISELWCADQRSLREVNKFAEGKRKYPKFSHLFSDLKTLTPQEKTQILGSLRKLCSFDKKQRNLQSAQVEFDALLLIRRTSGIRNAVLKDAVIYAHHQGITAYHRIYAPATSISLQKVIKLHDDLISSIQNIANHPDVIKEFTFALRIKNLQNLPKQDKVLLIKKIKDTIEFFVTNIEEFSDLVKYCENCLALSKHSDLEQTTLSEINDSLNNLSYAIDYVLGRCEFKLTTFDEIVQLNDIIGKNLKIIDQYISKLSYLFNTHAPNSTFKTYHSLLIQMRPTLANNLLSETKNKLKNIIKQFLLYEIDIRTISKNEDLNYLKNLTQSVTNATGPHMGLEVREQLKTIPLKFFKEGFFKHKRLKDAVEKTLEDFYRDTPHP